MMTTETPATVQMLNLQLPTDPRWVNLAEMDLEEILTDHAYCEQKATTSCISLVQGYPDYPGLVEAVAPVRCMRTGASRSMAPANERFARPCPLSIHPSSVPSRP